MKHRVKVDPELYLYAVKRSGRKLEEVKRGVPGFKDWLEGKSKPTVVQLRGLAKYTRTPIGYFYLDEAPEVKLPIADFRIPYGIEVDQFDIDLIDVINDCQARQSWLAEYLAIQGKSSLQWVSTLSIHDDPIKGAEVLKSLMYLPSGKRKSLEHFRKFLIINMEENGVIVNISSIVGWNPHRKLDIKQFRGIALYNKYAPLVFVNGSDSRSGQIFTLIHELAHILLGETGVDNVNIRASLKNENEIWCNRVSGEYLMPAPEIERALSRDVDSDLVNILRKEFQVSSQVVLRRLLDVGYIRYPEYRNLVLREMENSEKAATQKTRSGFGNPFATHVYRVSRYFANMLLEDTYRGDTSFVHAESLLAVKSRTFDKLAGYLGFP